MADEKQVVGGKRIVQQSRRWFCVDGLIVKDYQPCALTRYAEGHIRIGQPGGNHAGGEVSRKNHL
jgi:hypothetical protein